MSNKIISIILGIIFGLLIYNFFKQKKTIILNYNFNIEEEDKIRINNKCFKSN
jgi:hypothetical protein